MSTTASPSATDDLDAASDRILAMFEAQQELQQALVDMMKGATAGAGDFQTRIAQLQDLKQKHARVMHDLIDEHGWFDATRVGRTVTEAAFHIVKNAEHDSNLQRTVLSCIKDVRDGRPEDDEYHTFQGRQIALLTDTIRKANGRRQLYGTNVSIEDGEVTVPPIEAPEQLDARRAELGLPPHETYLDQIRSKVDLSLYA